MKKLIVVALVSIVGVAVWRTHGAEQPQTKKLLQDRVWIDHMPRNERDVVNVFAMLTEEPVGVFQAASAWRGNFEAFRYEAKGDEVRALFPQNGDKERWTATATKCDANGMDFCLELSGSSRGVKKYYSRKGWEIDGDRDLDAVNHRVDSLRGRLAAGN